MAWVINTKEDYDKAMEELENRKFLAEMSDDFSCWERETSKIYREMWDVKSQAEAKGIIAS